MKNIYQEIHQSILKTQAVSTNRDSPRPVFKRDFQTFQLSFNLQCKFSCLGLLFLREFRLQVPFILLQALFMDGPLRAIHNCCLSRGGGRGSKIVDFETTWFNDAMTIWIVEFSSGGYKIRKIFAKESTYLMEIIEF